MVSKPFVNSPPLQIEWADLGPFFPSYLEEVLRKKEANVLSVLDQSNTGNRTEGQTNVLYFRKAWNLRAIATILGLLKLIEGSYDPVLAVTRDQLAR